MEERFGCCLSMIMVLQKIARERLAPCVGNGEVADAVFRTMATIPMKWLGHTDQPIPFDVEDFFRRLDSASRAD